MGNHSGDSIETNMSPKSIVCFATVLLLQGITAHLHTSVNPGIIGNGHHGHPGNVPFEALPGIPYGPNLAYEAAVNAERANIAEAAIERAATPGFAALSSKLAGLFDGISAANGGTFTVTSSSPAGPIGLSVFSDNLLIEGPLAVAGQMPFLGTVALDGTLPAVGQGAVNYGSGNGNVGIVGENTPAAVEAGLGAGLPPYGPNPALAAGFGANAAGLPGPNGLAGPNGLPALGPKGALQNAYGKPGFGPGFPPVNGAF